MSIFQTSGKDQVIYKDTFRTTWFYSVLEIFFIGRWTIITHWRISSEYRCLLTKNYWFINPELCNWNKYFWNSWRLSNRESWEHFEFHCFVPYIFFYYFGWPRISFQNLLNMLIVWLLTLVWKKKKATLVCFWLQLSPSDQHWRIYSHVVQPRKKHKLISKFISLWKPVCSKGNSSGDTNMPFSFY